MFATFKLHELVMNLFIVCSRFLPFMEVLHVGHDNEST